MKTIAAPRHLPTLVSTAVLGLCLGSCQKVPADESPARVPLPSVPTGLVYEFQEWHDDFPYSLHVPPRSLGRWYDRNRQQALEKVVANLSGLCTPQAWATSKEFFVRHVEESKDLLIEKLDETQRRRDSYDHAENIVKAMGRVDSPAFADVLVRSAAHDHPGIRRAAYQALRFSGDEAAVVKVGAQFERMSRVEQVDFVKAAAAMMGDEQLFALFREMLTKQYYGHIQAFVFEEAMNLPGARAAALFEPIWLTMPEDLQLHIAGKFHEAGDERGTVRLRHALKPPVKLINRKTVAVQGAARGNPEPMLNELLMLTNEDYESLNVVIIEAIRNVPGQRVTDTLLTLTDRSKPFQVRQFALRALAERGETSELDYLVEQVRKEPEGSKFRNAVEDLVGARYGKAVPVILERMKKAARKREIFFIRKIARINRPESFAALEEVFLRPEYVIPWQEYQRSNVTFLGVQFSNLSGSTESMLHLMRSLPRADYRRRAALMHALANLAGANAEKVEMTERVYQALRERVFDPKEVPQIRILALDYMRKGFTLDDAMNLRQRLPKEPKGMRQYFSDYLFEFF